MYNNAPPPSYHHGQPNDMSHYPAMNPPPSYPLGAPPGDSFNHGYLAQQQQSQADGTHLLRATHLPMRTHVLRLLPGADIVLSLCAFAQELSMQAAVVLSCVGSTGQTIVRPVRQARSFSQE